MSETQARPLRADAQRNRDRLLDAAVTAFSADGPDVTLESIAKAAGVGIGTLYRNFPTREALIEAAYRNELTRLCDAVDDLLRELPADAALRAWMDRFIDYMATKRGMADALRVVIAHGGNPFSESRAMITAALATLLRAGVEAGRIRPDVEPADVFAGLGGVAMAVGEPALREQAGRVLDLLMDGMRFGARSG
ncbi:AcrR family transcriptional regulator [Allocatelliglobosispora scoriae]|uniref:AcrR family transcriptional regulator n=1 Tax=Allocatelliglobosispora scoriae TaxID=643052 RepID=A0A841BZZ4_9ACTN|nr:TetR/AcrR family transcriptional regulator [Allocatelliglobosispora scoriae]MBB5872463.1 AcrR family transcriptional regulator [Allocatelliglobosispora scoriae]